MRFDTLLALIKRGQVTKDSVVRGPTTHQLWKRAAEIKGVSREFGLCYSCGAEIDTQANLCRVQPSAGAAGESGRPGGFAWRSAGNEGSSDSAGAQPPAPVSRRRPIFERPLSPSSPPAPLPSSDADIVAPPAATCSLRVRWSPAARAAASYEEPVPIEMSPTTISMSDDDDPLAVTEETEVLARQITSRPPVKPPVVPPSTNASAAAARATARGGGGGGRRHEHSPATAGRRRCAAHPAGTRRGIPTGLRRRAGEREWRRRQWTRGRNGSTHRPRTFTVVLAVVLLIAAGAAALLYLRPDLRRKASGVGATTRMNSIRSFISSRARRRTTTSPPHTRPQQA
jgi:hypothetical protein